MKKRYIFALAYWILSSVVAVYAAYNLHFALVRGGQSYLDIFRIAEIFSTLKTDKILKLFMLIEGFNTLFVFWVLFGYSLSSKSAEPKEIEIIPGIYTPVATKSHLFGGAKWLAKKKFSKQFKCVNLKKHSDFNNLMQRGYDE